jgi:hypothetical protein
MEALVTEIVKSQWLFSLVIPIPIAVFLSFVVQAAKQAIPKPYHKFIPAGMLVVGPAVSVGLAVVMGHTWQMGITWGVVASAFAVFGYEFVKQAVTISADPPWSGGG